MTAVGGCLTFQAVRSQYTRAMFAMCRLIFSHTKYGARYVESKHRRWPEIFLPCWNFGTIWLALQRAANKSTESFTRMRGCLLKRFEQRFHPRQARQCYCSDHCRRAARKWSRWKAQQPYRATAAGNRDGMVNVDATATRQKSPYHPDALAYGICHALTL
jgi:hypothetical protein